MEKAYKEDIFSGSKNMVNSYRRGRIQEKKVENWMRDKGWTNLRRSKGSRGPADIYGDLHLKKNIQPGSL